MNLGDHARWSRRLSTTLVFILVLFGCGTQPPTTMRPGVASSPTVAGSPPPTSPRSSATPSSASSRAAETPVGQSPAQQRGDPLAGVPACPGLGTPLFDALPMMPMDFLAFRPLGWLSPPIHVFPAKHSNFSLARPGETPPRRPVHSPGKVWVTEINAVEYGGTGKTGYGITFYPCREFKAYFGHLSTVSERLQAELSAADTVCNSYETGGTPVKKCTGRTTVQLASGELVGYSGDAAGVDFGAVDYRMPPAAVANPAHYMREMLHYVSPVPSFTPEVRAALEAKLASYDGTVPRTAEPRTGEVIQDIPGTAQGNWFVPGKSWAIPFQQPDPFLALVHDYVDARYPVFSVGTSVKGLPVGVYGFTPRSSGRVNRDFGQVRADGAIYCYDRFDTGKTTGGIGLGDPRGGIVLLAMPTESTLMVEKQGTAGGTCETAMPWRLTENATLFER